MTEENNVIQEQQTKEKKMKYKCEICGREMKAGYYAHLIKCKKEHGTASPQEPIKEPTMIPEETETREEPIKTKDSGDKKPIQAKSFLAEWADEWF